MKFVIARFRSVTKITRLLHVSNTHETEVYKIILTLPCFTNFKKKQTKKKTNKQNENRNKKANKQATTRKEP